MICLGFQTLLKANALYVYLEHIVKATKAERMIVFISNYDRKKQIEDLNYEKVLCGKS